MTVRAAEWSVRGADGALLHFEVHEAGPIERGVCLVVHGLGEHAGKYAEWTRFAQGRGYHVTAFDQRGHGRTRGRRGDYAFDDLASDLGRCATVSAERYPELPLFILGHSLGALVALRYAAAEPHPRLAGVALSGPPLALARETPEWYRRTIVLLGRVAPRLPLPRRSDPARLTRDAERIDALRQDPLRHNWITPRAMISTDAAMRMIRTDPEAVSVPLLFLVGRADDIVRIADVDSYASFAGAGDATVVALPGAYHEVLNDLGRRAVFDTLCNWFDAHAR